MRRISSFSSVCFILFLFFFLFFVLLLLLTPHNKSSASSIDMIDKTCQTCADESKVFNYAFCFDSLQKIPISQATDLQGLAIVAMELALQNATNMVSIIQEMLNNSDPSPSSLACLNQCLELYSYGVVRLVGSIRAILFGRSDTANAWVSAVMEGATTCEAGFREKGVMSPLTRENNSLFQLCDIASCVIKLLAPDSSASMEHS